MPKEYIDREATIESIKENCTGCESYGGVLCTSCPLYDALLQLDMIPTADVAPVVHGEWIPVPSSDMATGKAYKCSNCERMRYGVRLPPYCQECGAKMDGGTP